MLLWVDYTNHHDKRAWRCIVPRGEPYVGLYHHGDPNTSRTSTKTWVWDVSMVDRDMAKRTLRLDHIYGFFVGEHPIRNRLIDGEARGEPHPLEDGI